MFGYTPKPRGFHHNYIYVDERREHLDELEKRARWQIEGREAANDNSIHPLLQFSADKRKQRGYQAHRTSHLLTPLIPIIIIGGVALLCCYYYFC